MRLSAVRRRRSLGSWGVLLCALLAMGIYVTFDLLDLDGSDLCGRLLRNAIAIDPPQDDAELFLAQGPLSPNGLRLAAISPAFQSVPDRGKVTLRTAAATPTPGPNRILLRAQARRGISSTTRISPTGDPA